MSQPIFKPGRNDRKLGLLLALVCSTSATPHLAAQSSSSPLLPEQIIEAVAAEVSGSTARHTVQELSLQHRMRGSQGFQAAVEALARRATDYGLEQVEILKFTADGAIFYGTQRSRPGWDANFAELWEMGPSGQGWAPQQLIASWQDNPVTLAQDSAGGAVTAELVDIGPGTSPDDYAADVSGRLVLTSSQPGAIYELAVERFGAAGIISYAQNQKTAWWGEDETLVRWGHLETFPPPRTFAFMVSLKQARLWQRRMKEGGQIMLSARVEAGQHAGNYEILSAVIPGADPEFRDKEIVFSCHLDHQRPGANDNASGCATILEVARTLSKLVKEGKIPAPARSIRFVWPPEIEGTITLLNARPDLAGRILAAIHMDMVGGGPETKAIFHITRSPRSLPTFVSDVAEEFGQLVNQQSDLLASTGSARYPLNSPSGGKEALQADFVEFTSGSDHQVYTEGSFRIPAIYMNDWPDRYIHTHRDSIDNIDATKLQRVAFIGALSGYFLATFTESEQVPGILQVLKRQWLRRSAAWLDRSRQLQSTSLEQEAPLLLDHHFRYEKAVLNSISRFTTIPDEMRATSQRFLNGLQELLNGPRSDAVRSESGPGAAVYQRAAEPKGPMSAFGYGYLEDQLKRRGLSAPALLSHHGLWGKGSDYAYEALNLVNGQRSVREIRNELTAIYGPVDLQLVEEFLNQLLQIDVLTKNRLPFGI